MSKTAQTQYPVHPLIGERWSPRAFANRRIESEMLGSLFEAARWAPSCYNEQPWAFLVANASEREGFQRMSACLLDGNRWAEEASTLILTVAKSRFERNGQLNRHAWHDVGLATANLVLQAEAHGLVSHQIAGFDTELATRSLGIPEGFEPVAMIAVGFRGDPKDLPDALREREQARRARKPLNEMAFGPGWGVSLEDE